MIDYYEILGVERDACPTQIKHAYRKKAQALHPDKENGDAAAFRELREAYQVLYDDVKREKYDRGEYIDSGANIIRQEARNRLVIMALTQLVDNEQNTGPGIDIIKVLRDWIGRSFAQIDKDLAKNENAIQRYEKIKARIKYTGDGDDLFAAILDEKISRAKKNIAHIKREKEIFDCAIEILKDYSCEVRESIIWGSSTTHATTATETRMSEGWDP